VLLGSGVLDAADPDNIEAADHLLGDGDETKIQANSTQDEW
jgi:hypothetical protein